MAEMYGTDQFLVPEFQNRKVIDEISMSMSVFDCMLPDHAGIYCSSDITSGKWLYYGLLKKHNASSPEILIGELGEEAFKNLRKPFLDSNIERGNQFAQKLRERGLINVVTPGPYYAKGFDQQHYLYLWELFIIKKIYEVRFNVDWQYSNGCTLEYAIAARKGIPRLDHAGNRLELEPAIARVAAAVDQLKADGFAVAKLEHNLGLMNSISR
jgi:hypothetical protein